MQESNRNTDGTFKEGVSGNPSGRPPGKTLKEFARLYLMSLSPEDKLDYLATLPPEIVWRMAEGNPTEDKNVKISIPVPILGGSSQAITASEPQTTLSSPQHGLDTPSAHNIPCAQVLDVPTDDASSIDTTQSSVLAEEIMDA